MARKTKEVRITSGTLETNRDHGKLFVITEMSAMNAERWASDALHGLTQAGVELPDDIKSAGTMGIATLGMKALGGVPPDVMHDLMDRMMTCIVYYPDPQRREVFRPATGLPPYENDIEEISTLARLRGECFMLHTNFTWADVKSLAAQTPMAQN